MQTNLSPKELATVIGVSESSLKRWVDDGRLEAVRTAGGHRRIALPEAVRFIRHTAAEVSHPEMLGVADLTAEAVATVARGAGDKAILTALTDGDDRAARGLILAEFLLSRSVASVCDGPITYAMHRLGERKSNGVNGPTPAEHRATEACLEALHRVRSLLHNPPEGAPAAVGGAAPGDSLQLGTLMAATVLREIGFRDTNLGADSAVESLVRSAREADARLLWVSMSGAPDRARVASISEPLARFAGESGAVLVIGGRGAVGTAPIRIPGVVLVSSLSELASCGRAVRSEAGGGVPLRVETVVRPRAVRAMTG